MSAAKTKEKKNGVYYTPPTLADFISYHIFTNYNFASTIDVLEPSSGDGVFFDSLFADRLLRKKVKRPNLLMTAVEIDEDALSSLKQKTKNYTDKATFFNQDYLDYYHENKKKFDLVIGNPPYVKSNHLSKRQIKACEAIHKESDLSPKKIKNIWTSFLIGGAQSLKDDGVLCYVLPAEILQVMYAKELRNFLKSRFKRIEIFAFNELIFPDIEQDVIILICTNQPTHGVSFYHVNTLKDLEKPEYVKEHSNIHRETLDKWTNYILDDEELRFLDGLKASLQPIKEYCRAEVGVVTAANNYFIVDESTVESYKLQDIAKPMLQKGMHLTSSIDFKPSDLEQIRVSGKPSYFLAFANSDSKQFPKGFKDYLSVGRRQSINLRYKCQLRDYWYHVPSTWISEGFFTKRSNIYPRTIVNSSKTLVTDSFYRIKMHEGYRIQDLVFSFHNTLTFIFAELEGRYYGGSVLELMPNEYKNLALPFCHGIDKKTLTTLDNMIREKRNVKDILRYTDSIVLGKHYKISPEAIDKLGKIYDKLLVRRLKGKKVR